MDLLLIAAVAIVIIIVSKKRKEAKAKEALEQLILHADKSDSYDSRQQLSNAQSRFGYSDDKVHQIRMDLYSRLAQDGNLFAKYQLGKHAFYNEKDPSKALQWLTAAAQGGYPDALYLLGDGYCKYRNDNAIIGCGFGYDPVKSFEYYLKAAEAGYAEAMWDVALCYMTGEGTVVDTQKRLYWLRKGTELKNWRCANALAEHYSSPINPQCNLEAALDLHRKSINFVRSRDDFATTLHNMGMIYGRGYIGGKETPSSDRVAATYCFIMAHLADKDRDIDKEYAQKTGYAISQQEFEALLNNVQNMRINF